MTSDPRAAFAHTAEAAQQTAGMIAARARGDLAGAERLAAGMTDADRAAGGVFLADLAIALLASAEGRCVSDVAAELSVHLAATDGPTPGDAWR